MRRSSRTPWALLALVFLVLVGSASAATASRGQQNDRISGARAQAQQQAQQQARQQAQRVSHARQQQVAQRAARARAQQRAKRTEAARRQQEAKRVQAMRAQQQRKDRMRAQKARQSAQSDGASRIQGARAQYAAASKSQRVGSARQNAAEKRAKRISAARLNSPATTSSADRAQAARDALKSQQLSEHPMATRFLQIQEEHQALLQRLDNYAAQLRANGNAELLPRVALLRQSAIASFEAIKAEVRAALQTSR